MSDQLENEAVDYIANGSRWMCKSTTFAKAILGYTALGSFGLLLVATRLTASIPNLPGGGTVCTVTESQWIKIPLQNPQPQGKGEVKNVQELPDLDIDGKHYFCQPRTYHTKGFAECQNFGRSGQLEGVVALIARRSRLHPGTRYLARGINSCFSTGNEAECEQLVWIPKRSGQSVPFNAYIWRRGTIPIWWGAELKLTAAEAEIYVADRDPYKGSLKYYQRLSNRYDARNFDLAVGENQKKKPFIPIVCINLLRNAEGKSESILVQHFEESLNYTLDRTNAASYFGALRVFVEQCRRLGVSLDSDFACGYQSANNYGGYTAPLPRGWEKRADAATGKTYYIDHNTRTTTWIHPCPDKPWKRFDMTFEEFKQSTILSLVSQLEDLFLLCGDIHATLYTGSKAMHSQILNIFNEEPGKFKQFSAAQNMKITLQRRYKNAVVDSSRQKQLEMFLGLRVFKHLPSASVQPLHVLPRPSGFFLKPVPNMFPSSDGGASLLSFKRKDMIWGASIPRCGNGTNLLIPLPGSVSAEDMAITGAGARLHDQDAPTLPLLYDFEELEGELDFLTRFVAITFYPAISGTSSMTLGEIEILGVSLPWRGVFNNEGPGARLIELGKKFQKETDPFLSNSVTKTVPFSNENVSTSMQTEAASNHWVDLLSGGDTFSDPLSEPFSNPLSEPFSDPLSEPFSDPLSESVTRNVASGGADLLDFLDRPIVEDHGVETYKRFSTQDGCSLASGAQQYISCLKSLAGPREEKKLDFMEAMKLEIERLQLNLSAAERDRALLSIGTDPASINPNVLLDESYMGRLCRVATTLALLGQASLEDKIVGAIGLENSDDRRGALLFSNYKSRDVTNYNGFSSQSGSSHGSQVDVSTSRSLTLDGVICKHCCHEIVLDALMLDYVRVLISLLRSSRADNAAYNALNEVVGSCLKDSLSESIQSSDNVQAAEVLHQLCGGQESLAEFPFASFLDSVETAKDSALILSLLAPLNSGSRHSYWRAPPSTTSVEFVIVLGSVSDVSGVILLVSPCGYSVADTPMVGAIFIPLFPCCSINFGDKLSGLNNEAQYQGWWVQIWASNKIHREEGSSMGKWDVQSLITSSSDLHGPEKSASVEKLPRHVKFTFKNPVRCRIIWITLRLQRPGSASVNFGKDFSLLSLDEDENPFAQVDRRASFGGAVENEPCIHAKRILVVGSPVKREGLTSSQSSEQLSIRNWLDRAPQMSRFKVPIEAERLMDYDLVLEQYLPPASPSLAGFRLDTFSAIKPRVTHSPSSDSDIWDKSVTFLEDRYISQAVLYLQVSALQEPHNMVTIAEYRLPEARAGTPMYFDFPRPIQSRRVSFKLLGVVTAFADEPSEPDDSGLRAPLVATGLSLSNRIKLYYYCDPSELGKWASLSAV
ncbi:putative phosphoinositide phosphatase SAC9 [Citrus sinensis]|nr:putative phosphoinositide phosphatase SAC9 [Citrus sinensis]